MSTDPVRRAQTLVAQGRPGDALAITAPLVKGASAPASLLAVHGAALQALGEPAEALDAYERAACAAPDSAVAQHNLASALGDLRRFAESAAAARRAFSKGLDAPETWLVNARALVGLGELDRADRAFREALRRRPVYAEAHRDLAQLIWMRTGQVGLAVSVLDAAIADAPAALPLRLARAKVQEFGGDIEGAASTVADGLNLDPGDVSLRLAASHLAMLRGRAEEAVAHADAAAARAPGAPAVAAALCIAWLGLGAVREAGDLAQAMLARSPHDQMAWALQATAWRLAGDPRWREVWDFQRLVQAYTIETPPGWTDLPSYLADLKEALVGLHRGLISHPLDQSLRGGSQTTQHLEAAEHPAIQTFFKAVDGPIRSYIAGLGRGQGSMGSRNTGEYRLKGAWSVFLGRGGSHLDHVHVEGWISSAFYVDLPTAVEAPDRQGWIRFGQPPFPTRPPLAAEHHVKPSPGTLVLFPSYLWHGTVPFTTDEKRLTIAFDLLPASAERPG